MVRTHRAKRADRVRKIGKKNAVAEPRITRSKSNLKKEFDIQTRSKSKKIEQIQKESDSNKCRPQVSLNDTGIQSESLSLSKIQFVKLNDFAVNSIVLAKQKYSKPWPSRVLNIEKDRVFVYFYGDKRSGYVEKTEIYDFILSVNAIKAKIASKKIERSYMTGLVEIEALLNIPREYSLFATI